MSHIPTEPRPGDLAEIQGLYGAFSFPERLLQKIWLRREFDRASARTTEGRRVRIAHPGRWNLLGGPDFHSARVQFDDGPEVIGDVELHLRAADWDAHGHERDPAYRGVVLHVVLFWPEPGYVTHGVDGAGIPILPLLPLLYHDLEEYAADEAVEVLSNRPGARLTNELAVHSVAELKVMLASRARERWRQKVHFAAQRVRKLGWEAACHHAALEVLGFRYNRAPMLQIATRWPLSAWRASRFDVAAAFASEADAWSLQGVRPANHPRTRLGQYLAWTMACPDWPAKLADCSSRLPVIPPSGTTRQHRRDQQMPALRTHVSQTICAGCVGGTRLDNLICDAFFPLLAAVSATPDRFGCWYHWFCGDIPPFVNSGLRQLSVCDGRDQPACHGLAQGLLGWLIEREVRR